MSNTKKQFKILSLLPIFFAVFGLGVFAFSSRAQAAIYYVSIAGNDSYSGITLVQPFRSIQHAVNVAQGGSDTIYVRAGTYNEYISGITSGTTISSYNSETVILDGGRTFSAGETWTHVGAGVYRNNGAFSTRVRNVYVIDDEGTSKHLWEVTADTWETWLNKNTGAKILGPLYDPLVHNKIWDTIGGMIHWGSSSLWLSFRDDAVPASKTLKYSLLGDYAFYLNGETEVTIHGFHIRNYEICINLTNSDFNIIEYNDIANCNAKIQFNSGSDSNIVRHNYIHSETLDEYIGGGWLKTYACDYQTPIYGNLTANVNWCTVGNPCYCEFTDNHPKYCKGDVITTCTVNADCASGECVAYNTNAKSNKYHIPKQFNDDNGHISDSGIRVESGNSNKILKNRINNVPFSISIWGYNNEVGGNEVYHTSTATGLYAGSYGTKYHDNLFYDCDECLRMDLASTIRAYVYNNRFYLPPWISTGFLPTSGDNGSPTVHLYHNTFAGGSAMIGSLYSRGGNITARNNLISAQQGIISGNIGTAANNAVYGRYVSSSATLYNNNQAFNHTVGQAEFASGNDSSFFPLLNIQAVDDFPYWEKAWTHLHTNEMGATNIVNLGLPGFESNYYTGSAPDVGWVGHAPAPALLASDNNVISLNWSAPSPARPNRIIEDYTIFRKLSEETQYFELKTVAGSAYIDSAAISGAIYNYVIQANYDDGSISIWSNEITATVSGSNPADVNNDTSVNIKDIQACVKVITGTDTTYREQCKVLADPTDTVSIKDIQVIVSAIVNP